MDKLTMSIEEAAKVLGVGRNFCYELAKTGQLPTIRLGSRRLVVPRIALQKMLEAANAQPRKSDATRKPASFEHQLHDLMEGMWEYYENDGTIYDEVTAWARDWVAGREYEASTHLSKRFDI
jgi:excisionase family DNA binding protein